MRLTNSLFIAFLSGFFLSACGSDKTSKTVTSNVTAETTAIDSVKTDIIQPSATVKGSVSDQTVRNWRINDTLELECSHPLATFITDEQHSPQIVWGQIALRGRHGWYKLLDDKTYWTLYHASASSDGKLFQLPTVGEEAKIDRVRNPSKKPLKVSENDFFYNTYDVTYLTWTEYLDEELSALPARQIEANYLGGEFDDKIYCPLPYWLDQEKIRLKNTNHLPTSEQLAAYLELSQDTTAHTGRLGPSYRPLLASLLRSYQPYTMSPDTARLINEALHSLNSTKR